MGCVSLPWLRVTLRRVMTLLDWLKHPSRNSALSLERSGSGPLKSLSTAQRTASGGLVPLTADARQQSQETSGNLSERSHFFRCARRRLTTMHPGRYLAHAKRTSLRKLR